MELEKRRTGYRCLWSPLRREQGHLSGAEAKGFEFKERGGNLWNVSDVEGNGPKKWYLAVRRQHQIK